MTDGKIRIINSLKDVLKNIPNVIIDLIGNYILNTDFQLKHTINFDIKRRDTKFLSNGTIIVKLTDGSLKIYDIETETFLYTLKEPDAIDHYTNINIFEEKILILDHHQNSYPITAIHQEIYDLEKKCCIATFPTPQYFLDTKIKSICDAYIEAFIFTQDGYISLIKIDRNTSKYTRIVSSTKITSQITSVFILNDKQFITTKFHYQDNENGTYKFTKWNFDSNSTQKFTKHKYTILDNSQYHYTIDNIKILSQTQIILYGTRLTKNFNPIQNENGSNNDHLNNNDLNDNNLNNNGLNNNDLNDNNLNNNDLNDNDLNDNDNDLNDNDLNDNDLNDNDLNDYLNIEGYIAIFDLEMMKIINEIIIETEISNLEVISNNKIICLIDSEIDIYNIITLEKEQTLCTTSDQCLIFTTLLDKQILWKTNDGFKIYNTFSGTKSKSIRNQHRTIQKLMAYNNGSISYMLNNKIEIYT